ncbi:histidine phosphatase family protein [Bacilliculturomica massiliensis]|uniref:histidine phosphatase family protein n=1 Tax=Bacilliculturomica massiliensis TaxID=1917867 RepID=UPI00102FD169|nr:histidine phosphatase family protein [Bacilliculturomica massiliensis]
MEIYLMRHGETDWNKAGKIQGSADIPLNEYGRQLAKMTAEGLSDTYFDLAYTSPLIRAAETAQIVAGSRGIPVIADRRLQEMDFGSSEGSEISRCAADENSVLYTFLKKPELYVPADGEAFSDVEARSRSFIRQVLVPNEEKWTRILITAHGAFIRCFLNCIEHRPLAEFWEGIPQRNCAVNILECQQGKLSILEEGKLYYQV